MGKKHRLRVAVIGCGDAGRTLHLPALSRLSDVEITGIADKDEERLAATAHRFGIRNYATDYRRILDDVEVVAICVPPRLHCPIALDALSAGKHVFLEKPLALDPNECQMLVGAARESGLCVTAGMNLRWHSLVRRALEFAASGRLGKLLKIESAVRTPWPSSHQDWRNADDLSGHILLETGVHHFDLWRLLSQSDVVNVSATYVRGPDGSQRSQVSGTMANGTAVCSMFSNVGGIENEFKVLGTRGAVRFSCYDAMSFEMTNGRPYALQTAIGKARELAGAMWRFRHRGTFMDSYRVHWRHFLDCILDGRSVEPSFEDGQKAVETALAAIRSAELRQPVWLRAPADAVFRSRA